MFGRFIAPSYGEVSISENTGVKRYKSMQYFMKTRVKVGPWGATKEAISKCLNDMEMI